MYLQREKIDNKEKFSKRNTKILIVNFVLHNGVVGNWLSLINGPNCVAHVRGKNQQQIHDYQIRSCNFLYNRKIIVIF